ncbi:hypothetical protein BBJ66_05830 [Rhizobium sp. RSm-3]|nr:hypothetical protein BBJ66_05830 [Rhizobium sp. RSm-3]
MHPDFPIADGVRMIHGDGGSTVFVSVKKPLGNPFDGDGDYEVKARAGRYAAGIYHIRRVWSDADEKFLLWGAYHWDGFLIAPREIIAPADLVRKIEGNAT